MREAQKVKRLWLTFTSSFPVLFGKPPEFDPARLIWMKFQSERGVKHVVHLLLQERIGQRIQRIVLAAPRPETIREAEKVLLINLIEDGGHCVLDDLVLQRRDS